MLLKNSHLRLNRQNKFCGDKFWVKPLLPGKVTQIRTSIAIHQPIRRTYVFTQNFVATGTYSDGSTADVSSLVTWHSSDATIAHLPNRKADY